MSELIQKSENANFRWKLLAGASALALMGYVATMPAAKAADSDRPTVWIELGGQLSRWENGQEIYAPAFTELTPSNLSPPQRSERPPRYGVDESAALLFQPKGADWIFSASIRYGRSGNSKHSRQQSNPAAYTRYSKFHRSSYGVYHHFTHYIQVNPVAPRFTDVVAKQSESHTILDFQAGKDLGIGMFGRDALSTLNFGVRFAQFTSKSSVNLRENPDWQFKTHITTFGTAYDSYYRGHVTFHRTSQGVYQPFHSFAGSFLASRSLSALGPSISWNSSEPLIGNSESGEMTIDWGVNAALLFGRQKTKIHHQTTGRYHSSHAGQSALPITYQRMPEDQSRSRGVVVPNIGAFAGFSVKYPSAKVTFGYKADFFFGAMDGGIDVRRTEDIGFHGPYASISIGLGG
jgi:hypothetical protein